MHVGFGFSGNGIILNKMNTDNIGITLTGIILNELGITVCPFKSST